MTLIQENALNKVSEILRTYSNVQLENEYDAILIKKLTYTNLLKENTKKSSGQSHIALGGEAFDFFPHINITRYTNVKQSIANMKSFYILQVPIKLYKNNIDYANKSNMGNETFIGNKKEKKKTPKGYQDVIFDFKGKDFLTTFASVKLSRPSDPQLELGNTGKGISEDYFISFRELFFEDDFLIILKIANKLEYEAFIIKSNDGLKEGLQSSVIFLKEKSSTIIKVTGFNLDELPKINQPHQQIFSGAPGTGKSFKLKELANLYFNLDGISNYERITFHPNMNYGQFVGVYKPYPTENENAPVSYDYIPGILLRQLVKALKNPGENYLVLVEEINRANVAAVFGDTFQLLDRDSNGKSEYHIALSKDLERYLKTESGLSEELVNDLKENGLYFPPNLYIWASMNGADQGVMPIDTAFKRRWDFVKFDPNELTLLEFEDNDEGVKKKKIEEKILNNSYINYGDGNKIYWNSLRKTINGLLLKFNIPEDKLMGPYFISRNKMAIEEDVTKEFTSKVLMYLFEDVVKSNPKRLFNEENGNLYYSILVDRFKEVGPKVFKDIDFDSLHFETSKQQTPLINFIKEDQTESSELVSEEYTNINAKLTPEESIMTTTTLITDDVDRTK